jgi:NhaP-type Na+/H+ and K+/H+ antiporters with a unique C-terminal domain
VAIYRGESQIIPRGDTVIKAGDRLVTMVNAAKRAKMKEILEELIN